MRSFAILLTIFLSYDAPVKGQVSIIEILKRCVIMVAEVEKQGDQILLLQIDCVKKSQNSSQTYSLPSGSSYRIIAIGDDRIEDIDLCVYDEYGNRIACDNDSKNVAIVSCKPNLSGRFKFTVSPYAMKDSYSDGFFSLIVTRE